MLEFPKQILLINVVLCGVNYFGSMAIKVFPVFIEMCEFLLLKSVYITNLSLQLPLNKRLCFCLVI